MTERRTGMVLGGRAFQSRTAALKNQIAAPTQRSVKRMLTMTSMSCRSRAPTIPFRRAPT